MKVTAIGNPDNRNPDGSPRSLSSVFHSFSDLERTGNQIAMLEKIVETAQPFLYDSKSPTEGNEADREVQEAARKTAVLAFHQLDNILDDQSRWGTKDGDTDSEVKGVLKAETDRLKADAFLREQLGRPCHMLKAKIFRTQSGKLIALNDSQSVAGFGDTAAEAMDAFDTAYHEQQHLPVDTPAEQPAPQPSPVRKPRAKKK